MQRMTGEIGLRPATLADAHTLAELRVDSASERRAGLDPDGRASLLAASREAFEAGLRNGTLFAWLACDGERAIGSATLMLLPTLPRYGVAAACDGRIRNVSVAPDYRRRGIATRLMRAAMDKAAALRVDRLGLGTSDMGRSVYERLGFVPKDDEPDRSGS